VCFWLPSLALPCPADFALALPPGMEKSTWEKNNGERQTFSWGKELPNQGFFPVEFL